MCTEVYNLFGDADCQHKEYQNTFPCHMARRCHPDDDQVLKEPIFLPARQPNVPPGLLGCKVRRATRPRAGKCRGCTRKQLRATQGNRDNNNNVVEATRPSTSPSTSTSSTRSEKSTARRLATPDTDPDPRALARMSESFMQVSKKQRTTPQSIGSSRGR